MTFRDHGYYGYAYLGARIAQAITLLPIIGLVGNFLSLIAKSKHSPPSELVATIVFSVISFLWILLSVTAYDDTHIHYLVTLGLDTAFMVPFVVFAVVLGQPLSLTTCSDLPAGAGHVALPISALAGRPVSYVVFSGAGRTVCYELMAVWGLMIALCVLFALSAVSAGFLFLGKRRGQAAANGGVMGGAGGQPGMVGGGMFAGGGGYPTNESQIEMAGGKGFVSRSPSIGLSASGRGTPYGGGGFDRPVPPPTGPQQGRFEESPRASFDDAPLSPPPPMRR